MWRAIFRAPPGAQPAQQRIVARDNLGHCNGAGCGSNRTGTRPAIVCSTLAREVDRLQSFSVDGVAFSAEQLENCNARAR